VPDTNTSPGPADEPPARSMPGRASKPGPGKPPRTCSPRMAGVRPGPRRPTEAMPSGCEQRDPLANGTGALLPCRSTTGRAQRPQRASSTTGGARVQRRAPGAARVRDPNWRSFTGIERKRNARTWGTAGPAQLASVYRNAAEKERQFPTGAAPAPAPECRLRAWVPRRLRRHSVLAAAGHLPGPAAGCVSARGGGNGRTREGPGAAHAGALRCFGGKPVSRGSCGWPWWPRPPRPRWSGRPRSC
jgi:hypothetical protein